MDQNKCYFFFSGYYAVSTASDLLNHYHIRNRIVKAPVNMKHGCSFAVLVDKSDEDMGKYLLERGSISLSGVKYVD